MRFHSAVAAVALSVAAVLGCRMMQGAELEHRWVYVSRNLLPDENVPVVQDIFRRAAGAGYNGIVLTDSKFSRLHEMDQTYFDHVAAVKQTADEVGLEIIPCVMPIGYSSGILAHDPNLAEGLPVRDALFVVRDGKADVIADPPVALKNGDFEQADGHKFGGWDWQENVGESVFADTTVVHGGKVAARMEGIRTAAPEHGNCRFHQLVKVAPFRCYHIEAWTKTEGFENPGGVRIAVLTKSGKSLQYKHLDIRPTQDWTRQDVVFNSLDNTELRIYVGVWQGRGGKLWWDEVKLEEVGLLNVLRRPGCPLIVRGEEGTAYEEGRDFAPVADERLGTVPWSGSYELYHAWPALQLTPNSRLREGQRLRVSFYHPVIMGGGQVMCCLSEPKVYEILKDQVQRVNALLQPNGFFMSHDEMRVANWCKACQDRGMTPGEMLADNVRRCVGIIRDIRPDARIHVWSDMFDPNHNARGDYYLVNGSWAGSWEGLPSDVVIVNWFYRARKENLPWFAERGHQQILAGYYDKSEFHTPQWLRDAEGIPGVAGVMYTTWRHQYDDLEGFARAVWGG